MKFTSQICTSRSQSERLLDLGLKKETADMKLITYSRFAVPVDYYTNIYVDDPDENDFCRAWSLHRLMDILHIHYIELWLDENAYEQVISLIEAQMKDGFFKKEYLEEL